MSNVVPFTKNQLQPSELDDLVSYSDMTKGLAPNLAVLSIRGGKFHLRHGGQEQVLFNQDAEGNKTPKSSVDVVLLNVSEDLTKTYYAEAFQEGKITAPTCYSFDGVRPAPDAQEPQCKLCQNCDWNKFKHKTSSGKLGKKCSDSRRVALIPEPDLPSLETGPILLRVPVMSLENLRRYSLYLERNLGNIKYNSIVTKISFDPKSTYPKLMFAPVRGLEPEEKPVVLQHYRNGGVSRVMQDSTEFATPPAAAPADPEPAAEPEIEEVVKPKVTKARTTKPKGGNGTRGRKPQMTAEATEEVVADSGPPQVVESSELPDSLAGMEGLEALPKDDSDLWVKR